jgi:methionyl-tRNA formyltransferase
MNVLVLGIRPSPLTPILEKHGCRVVECEGPIDVKYLKSHAIEFAVSYRYRHIIRKPIIEYLRWNVINLHVSLLPWNRGADPNLWSFLEDTPKGVTIHYIDEGIDTGDIIAQKEVVFDTSNETLATTYDRLNAEILELFRSHWPLIMQIKAYRRKQPFGESFHKTKDKEQFMHLLAKNGWDTPVEKLVGKALK